MKSKSVVIAAGILFFPGIAQAYIGPGMGAGVVAAVFGIVGSIFIGIFAVVFYPIKRALRRKRVAAEAKETGSEANKSASELDDG